MCKITMKKIVPMFVALASVLVFASGIMAQSSPSGTTTPAPGAAAKMEKFNGVLEGVDQAGHSFVVQKQKEKMTFYWNDQTKIMQGKKTLTSTDLKKGEHVKVAYKEEGGKATAESINVGTKAHPKKSESKS